MGVQQERSSLTQKSKIIFFLQHDNVQLNNFKIISYSVFFCFCFFNQSETSRRPGS